MRRLGSIAPASWGAVFTGQAVLLSPALTALTRAMLSFLVRPLMVGTVIGGSFAAESFPVPLAVLDAVRTAVGAVDELATPAAEAVEGPSGMTSPAGVGRASLLAHAMDTKNAKGMSMPVDECLLNKLRCIS